MLEQYGNCVRRVSPSGEVTTIQIEEPCIRKISDAILHSLAGGGFAGIAAAPDGTVLVSRGNSVFQIDSNAEDFKVDHYRIAFREISILPDLTISSVHYL